MSTYEKTRMSYFDLDYNILDYNILEISLLSMGTAEAIKVLFNFYKTWAQCTFRLTWGQERGTRVLG